MHVGFSVVVERIEGLARYFYSACETCGPNWRGSELKITSVGTGSTWY